MNDQEVQEAAAGIAELIITAVRDSEGPVVWVTGNSYMPPLRSFPYAERVYQDPGNHDGEQFAYLVQLVESNLAAASVYLDCPEFDNALYAVDLKRWKYRDDDDVYDGTAEYDNLEDEWERIQ